MGHIFGTTCPWLPQLNHRKEAEGANTYWVNSKHCSNQEAILSHSPRGATNYTEAILWLPWHTLLSMWLPTKMAQIERLVNDLRSIKLNKTFRDAPIADCLAQHDKSNISITQRVTYIGAVPWFHWWWLHVKKTLQQSRTF